MNFGDIGEKKVFLLGVSRISKANIEGIRESSLYIHLMFISREESLQESLLTSGPHLDAVLEKFGEYETFSEKLWDEEDHESEVADYESVIVLFIQH